MNSIKRTFNELFKYPSAVAGLIIILLLIALSIYTLIALPYDRAISLWRGESKDWYASPKYAMPAWINSFRKNKLPTTIILKTDDPSVVKTEEKATVIYEMPFVFTADAFPSEINVFFKSTYTSSPPFVGLSIITPDEREIKLGNFKVERSLAYYLSQDQKLVKKYKDIPIQEALLMQPDSKPRKPLKGTYKLIIEGVTFDEGSTVSSEAVFYGKVSGIAGTDHKRRDLSIALLWGTPIALMFGLVAAVGTSLTQLIISAISTWFGGWIDVLIQRITNVNMVLPFLPILIMIGTFYSRSIFVILTCVILLSIFGAGILTYRAMFMQIKESPYIEASRSYGASNSRVIFKYMVPRLIPMLIPGFVSLIPSYVFLESSLAILGLGDPTIPTWGKVIDESYNSGALFNGYYYWVLEPSFLLVVTGLAFAVVGYALDRVFNPRLRGQ